MPNFLRLFNNSIYNLGEVSKLGFPKNDSSFIPDEYIKEGKFILTRLCNGLGDWGIISAFPRLLKQKYPHCKIYLPSEKLIGDLFGYSSWSHWPQPEKNCSRIFSNNPYIDGYVDSFDGEIFHDHYRIYDENNTTTPLIKQLMLFWRFSEQECFDYEPELYFSEEEIKEGDELIKNFIKDSEFGGFICTSSQLQKGEFFEENRNNKLINILNNNKLKYVYYGGVDIDKTPFKDHINVVLDFNQIKTPLRIQLYIRSKAKINIGYQSSMFEIICRYTSIVCTEIDGGPKENFFPIIKYL